MRHFANKNVDDAITFRAGEFLTLLQQDAAKNERSVGLHAKTLVHEALTDTSTLEVRIEIEQLREEVRRVRGDIATVANIILMTVGKMTKEQAAKWVQEKLLAKYGDGSRKER